MVGGSSMFTSPPFAVEREIVGRDRDAGLGDGLSKSRCCCAATAERRAAWADCCSLFFGEDVKKLVNLLPFEVDALRGVGVSDCGVITAGVIELANGFRGSL